MRVGVVGAGGIGGFIAAALARAGTPVAVVARGAHLDAIRANGLRVQGDLGEFSARVDASDDLRDLGACDVLLLTFKAHQWPALLSQLEPLAATRTQIVTLQNGLPFWYVRDPPLRSVDPGGRIGRLFPDDRVIGGVVHVSGHIVAPGCVRQSGGMRYVLGDPSGGESERVRALAGVLAHAGLHPQCDPRIRTTVWLKLVNNAGLNPVSALRRLTIRAMLNDSRVHDEVRELMAEALHVGQALGVIDDVDLDERIAYAARLDDVRTSMLQDFEAMRPLELDPILGAVVELGERAGVEVSRTRAVYDALRAASVNAGGSG